MTTRAVVLGARFGGLAVTTWLRRLYSPQKLDIILVDRWQDTIYRPGLVHAMDQPPFGFVHRVSMPLSDHCRRLNIRSVQDIIVEIDPDGQKVYTASLPPISYDILFIATGSESAWEHIPGLNIKYGGLCEGYQARHSSWKREQWKQGHFVFAAGPIVGSPQWHPKISVGCECPLLESAFLFESWLVKQGLRDKTQITVLTPAASLAENGSPKIQRRVAQLMKTHGIEVLTQCQFERVTDKDIYIKGQRIPYDGSLWVPPAKGPSWLTDTKIDDGYGWIPTDNHLNHPRYENIYAVGDGISHPWPKMGHAAMVQSRVAVHHWHAKRQHKKLPAPYHPYLVWLLETGGPYSQFTVTDVFYGGSRNIVYQGRWPAWIKRIFQRSYVWTTGSLPIMP
ncbi:MAG: FAD-dependent oxidoreductase [Firmicutes bacterium]|nr:FAD-dependent oxidoreductase [Bacillota bacterium]